MDLPPVSRFIPRSLSRSLGLKFSFVPAGGSSFPSPFLTGSCGDISHLYTSRCFYGAPHDRGGKEMKDKMSKGMQLGPLDADFQVR